MQIHIFINIKRNLLYLLNTSKNSIDSMYSTHFICNAIIQILHINYNIIIINYKLTLSRLRFFNHICKNICINIRSLTTTIQLCIIEYYSVIINKNFRIYTVKNVNYLMSTKVRIFL